MLFIINTFRSVLTSLFKDQLFLSPQLLYYGSFVIFAIIPDLLPLYLKKRRKNEALRNPWCLRVTHFKFVNKLIFTEPYVVSIVTVWILFFSNGVFLLYMNFNSRGASNVQNKAFGKYVDTYFILHSIEHAWYMHGPEIFCSPVILLT